MASVCQIPPGPPFQREEQLIVGLGPVPPNLKLEH
jgi:hypothetical protein